MQVLNKKLNIHESYGKSEGYRVTPLSYFRFLYFKKNYGRLLKGLHSGARILEIGPGGGTFTEYLLKLGFKDITLCEYSAVISSELLRYFSDRPAVKVVNENAILHLRNNPEAYDAIISQQVIEHFTYADFLVLLDEIHRALRKDGLVMLETNNCANIIYGMYLRYCDHTHLLGFTPRSLENFLETQDLSVIETFPVYMTGVVDLAKSLIHKVFVKKPIRVETFNQKITRTPIGEKIRLGIFFIMRSFGILISRCISCLLIYPYEKSLGASKKSVFTPTFGVVAQKLNMGE